MVKEKSFGNIFEKLLAFLLNVKNLLTNSGLVTFIIHAIIVPFVRQVYNLVYYISLLIKKI